MEFILDFLSIYDIQIEGCLGSKVWNKKFEFQRIKGINAQVYIVLLLNILSIMFHFYVWLQTVWCIGLYITNKCKCSEHLSWVRIRHLLYWNPTKRQGFTVQYCKVGKDPKKKFKKSKKITPGTLDGISSRIFFLK